MFFSKMTKESDAEEKFLESGVKSYRKQWTEWKWDLVKEYFLFPGYGILAIFAQ